MLKNLFIHFSKYSLSNILIALAGLVSFPILTRMLTVEQYGVMSLIGATLTLVISFGKLGVQHSAIRFYSEINANKSPFNLTQFFSTVLTFSACAGAVFTGLWLLGLVFLPEHHYEGTVVPALFIASVLVFVRIFYSSILNIYRAKELSGLVSAHSVSIKYGGLMCMCLLLFYWQQDLRSVYGGMVIWELLTLVLIGYHLFKHFGEHIRFSVDPALLKTMLMYGIPMLGTELAYGLLNTGDRYIIQLLIGSDDLGRYAAAYNLCNIINGVIALSVAMAVRPMYLRLWAEEGKERTRQFIEMSTKYYWMASMPIVFGLSAISEDLISLLASSKYVEGAVIVPYVMSGFAIYGSAVIIAAGIFIYKQSMKLMIFVLASVLLNVSLNFALIPLFGIKGAAIATLVSFSALTAVMYFYASRLLFIRLPLLKIMQYTLAALVMYIGIMQFHYESYLYNLLFKITAGAAIYAAIIFLTERDIRYIVLKYTGIKA